VLEDARDIGEIILAVRRISDALQKPFSIDSHEVRATASIGISIFPDDGVDAGDLMRYADLAMYEAKGNKGSRWQFFSREMGEQVEARLKLESALAGAQERDELELFFQPIIAASDGSVAGCEALLRWHHDGRVLEAHEFISVAEDTGIILGIGDWVLAEVCIRIRDWSQRYGPLPIAMNVSARQLHDPEFVGRVLATLEGHGVDPQLMGVEITETVLMEDLDGSFKLLGQLREQGVVVAIDDFGVGYSSLSYLTRLPVNSLKIDKSFVSGPRRSKVVLSTIVAMAQALRLQTVAEGIETDEQWELLRNEGCDALQGFLVGRPMPAGDFETRFLSRHLPPLQRHGNE
jgi:EAL domain-containing protein (putative c-di-GMP-specific phosphodiesterase class I)